MKLLTITLLLATVSAAPTSAKDDLEADASAKSAEEIANFHKLIENQ